MNILVMVLVTTQLVYHRFRLRLLVKMKSSLLSQSQETTCGTVLYTGMDSDGDFTLVIPSILPVSEQKTFDVPTPTVTGRRS